MAKNSTPDVPAIEIHAYKPETRAGVYDGHVQALLNAETEFPEGEQPAVSITVPNGEKRTKNDEAWVNVTRHIFLFQQSAKNAGRSARIVGQDDLGDGNTRIEFILREKITRKRASDQAESAADADQADTAA